MADEYAEAIARLEDEVDAAVNRALEYLTAKEAAAELRRIADGWEEESA